MNLLRVDYQFYLDRMKEAKQRKKIDQEIIKLVHKMINTKHLSDSELNKLNELTKGDSK